MFNIHTRRFKYLKLRFKSNNFRAFNNVYIGTKIVSVSNAQQTNLKLLTNLKFI